MQWNMYHSLCVALTVLCWSPLTFGSLMPKCLKNSAKSYIGSVSGISGAIAAIIVSSPSISKASEGKYEYQPALQGLDYGKPRTYYPDFTQTKDGSLQYKVIKEGTGPVAKKGDLCSRGLGRVHNRILWATLPGAQWP